MHQRGHIARYQGLVGVAWIEQKTRSDDWVKGEGFVRPRPTDDPMKPPPTMARLAEEYLRQIVDLSPASDGLLYGVFG